MGVKVIDRQYNEIYTDGETDWLLGNVGDWQKCNVRVEVAIEFIASQQQPVSIDTINNAFILSNGRPWGEYGFDNGMTAVLNYTLEEDTTGDGNFDQVTTYQQSYSINNIFNSTMEVQQQIDVGGFDNIPTNFGTKRVTNVHFYVDQDPEGCRLNYGHVTNANYQASNLNSFIDQSITEFVFPNIQDVIPGQWVDMEPTGFQSGMSVRAARVRKLSDDPNEVFTQYNIPSTNELSLVMFDPLFGNTQFDSARSVQCNIQTPQSTYQSSVSGTLPQADSTGAFQNGANTNRAFLYNAASDYLQQYYFNVNFRVTNTSNLSAGDNRVMLSVLKYTNGASMDFVEKTTLRTWNNAETLVNDQLNYNGIVEFDINTSDSLVLIVEFEDDSVANNTLVSLTYKIEDGTIQLSDIDGVITSGVKRIYEFEIQYMISSIFDSIANFEDNTMPSYLEGDGSVTDNFKIQFYPEWNNPNVLIENELEQTARLGNTGWFNENYNQLNNDFAIESMEYFDENGNPVDSLDFSSTTKVKAVITGVPNLNANTECGFGFAWVPQDEEDYKNMTTPFYRNVYVQTGSIDDGYSLDTSYPDTVFGSGLGGASLDVDSVRFSKLGGKIVFEANFTPNAEFFAQFDAKDETDRNYIFWLSVADGDLERNFSDRVSLLADFNEMTKNIPPAGEYPYIDNAFLEHHELEDAEGEVELQAITQDDFLCRMPFRIPKDGSINFTQMTFGVHAYNIGENRTFDLERFDVDVSLFPTDTDGIQQFAYDNTRGFKLETGNNKNWVKVEREPLMDTDDFAGYIAYFATKIRWEDWILNEETPNFFFDASEQNDGFHNDWIHYLRTAGWNVYFFTEIIATENDELKLYENRWRFNFVDYDENTALVAVTHEYYRDADNTLLNVGTDPDTGRPLGVILSNEPTRIEITFEDLQAVGWDIGQSYGVMTIEIDNGAGEMEQRQLSSVWGSESDNPLVPLTGETKLKLEVSGASNEFIKMSALVDPDLLSPAARYRITGRIGCALTGGGNFDAGLYEFRYEETYE